MTAPNSEQIANVLVVGGGPAGLAGATHLARAGLSVIVVDARSGPHPDTATAALTPRTVTRFAELADLDLLNSGHRTSGIRVLAHGRSVELPWPSHNDHRRPGIVVSRRNFDGVLRSAAESSGAVVRSSSRAVAPLVDDGIVAGAIVKSLDGSQELHIRAQYVLIADGALSHFGRALGTARNRSYPMGVVARTRIQTEASADDWIEAAIDLHDQHGAPIPGFGWVFPGNDGSITVGVGLLTAFRETEGPPIADLLLSWVKRLPGHWAIDKADTDVSELDIESGRLPMGGSVHPKSGPNWLVAGDAAGLINPMNGAGLESALESGQIAAAVLIEAIRSGNGLALRQFERHLEAERGQQLPRSTRGGKAPDSDSVDPVGVEVANDSRRGPAYRHRPATRQQPRRRRTQLRTSRQVGIVDPRTKQLVEIGVRHRASTSPLRCGRRR